MKSPSLTPKQALLKAASYCAYQERCYKEVEEKLAEWGIYGTEAGEILIELSNQNYLNEERFACAFAGGKFRTKKWGKIKIRLELKARNISEYCIQKGLLEISEHDYLALLQDLAQQKLDSTKEKNILAAKQKTAHYLQSKGFEVELIWNILRQLNPT